MKSKYWLLLPTILWLNGCAGLTFDDVFTPAVPQTEEVRIKVKQQADQEEKAIVTLPVRNEAPANTVDSDKRIGEAVTCLSNELSKQFNLPDDFYGVKYYGDGSATVSLINPYTKRKGLFIDIKPRQNGSRLKLYPNYTTMSTAWRTLPEKCR